MIETFLSGRVRVLTGDLTRQETDAIVNAANSTLLGGGGVDGAIHSAGGPQILAECREIRSTLWPDGLPVGEAIITGAGRLPSRYVIHTVGPIYGQHGGREAELLAACYRNALRLAASRSLASVAFPAISTGVYGYPPEEAARVASEAIKGYLQEDEHGSLGEVRLVFFSPHHAEVFLNNHQFEK